MKRNGYSAYIRNLVAELPEAQQIYSADIAQALSTAFKLPLDKSKELTNVYLKRIADAGILEHLAKGIYYKPWATVFGSQEPTVYQFFAENLMYKNGHTIGYETGPSFLHTIGLTSVAPAQKHIATNHYRKILPPLSGIVRRKPVTGITDANARYLQVLDAIKALLHMDSNEIDAPDPANLIQDYIQHTHLDERRLLMVACDYYHPIIIVKTIDILKTGWADHQKEVAATR